MGVEDDPIYYNKDQTSGLNNVFLASTEYVNDLPDLSYNLKQFLYPFNLQKYSDYMTPQFAKNYVNEEFIGCDNTFGIDFLNLGKYEQLSTSQEMLDSEDLKLLVDSNQNSHAKSRTLNHTKNIAWLRKTEYISAESVRNTKMSDLVDRKLMQNAESYQKSTDSFKSLSVQIDAINTTFDDNKVDPSLHAIKSTKSKNITPVEIIPILPIAELPSSSKCSQVSFDSHPTFYGSDKMINVQDSLNAILRGLSGENGDDYVGYYIPRKIPPVAVESELFDEEMAANKKLKHYQLLREYNWNMNSSSSSSTNMAVHDIYAFVENTQSKTFEYMAIPTKIKLTKRLFNGRTPMENNLSQDIPHRNLIIEEETTSESITNDENPPIL